MSRPTTRLSLLFALAALAAIAPSARAAPPVDLGGATIELELRLPDGDGGFELRNEEDNLEFMNLANCTCSAEFGVRFELADAPATLPSEPVRVWVGTSCDDPDRERRDDLCKELDAFGDISELRSPRDRPVSVNDLIATDTSDCPRNETSRWVYAIIDENNDGVGEGDYAARLEIETDTSPPPPPVNLVASGAEGGIQVNWDLPDSREEDIEYIQFLCARADGSSEADDDFPREVDGRYQTAGVACGMPDDSDCPRAIERIVPGGSDGGVADAGSGDSDAGTEDDDAGTDTGECATDLPASLANLDPDQLCGGTAGTASSYRISGLTNDVPYHVVLVSVDRSLNPYAVYLGQHTPEEVTDFWEDYKDQGGSARGGCSAAGAGGGGILVLALLAVGAMFHRRRRRPCGGATAAGALLLLVALAGRTAVAQPWWETYDEPVQEAVGSSPVHWSVELKIGPYVPAVDSESSFDGDEKGPFERMFGDGPFLMSQITVDRYFLYPGGQLGLSLSGGYLTRAARAFTVDENGDPVMQDGRFVRSDGDKTTFRLWPTSLGLVYRFTQLDDLLRIPLVPYGRIGLSYYLWQVSRPGGGVAEAPTDACPEPDSPDCEGERARGGSLGWQATAGLAIRAERIDADAERSLRTELGIEHAGLVIEATYAVVDGFGADEKLSVGDLAWFGGINFEF